MTSTDQSEDKMMSETPKLLPCPFCGEDKKLVSFVRPDPTKIHGVECWTCGATGGYANGKHESAEIWNRRAVNSHEALVAALREIADGCVTRRPGHVDAGKNRTKAEIEEIAQAALSQARA